MKATRTAAEWYASKARVQQKLDAVPATWARSWGSAQAILMTRHAQVGHDVQPSLMNRADMSLVEATDYFAMDATDHVPDLPL